MNLYHFFEVFYFVSPAEDCVFEMLFVVDFKLAVFIAEKMLKTRRMREDNKNRGGERTIQIKKTIKIRCWWCRENNGNLW